MNERDLWHQLLEVYFAVKQIYAICEEADEELMTNLQPLNEFRAAFDHVMRVKAIEDEEVLSKVFKGELSDDFGKQNLQSAISHLYRAFFDTCDSISISYRERIRESLEGFSKEAIATALPDYYPKMRPRIDEINREIASMRINKGQNPSTKMQDINHYTETIEELAGYLGKVNAAQSSLLELQASEKEAEEKRRKESLRNNVVIPIACAIGGVVFGVLATIFIGG